MHHMNAATVAILGAGQRGRDVYGRWIADNPDLMRIVGVCDLDDGRALRMADTHGLAPSEVSSTPDDFFGRGRIADSLIIATPDRAHFEHARRALELGYHVLVEKPMAATLDETTRLVELSESSTGSLHVGHVLRHTPFFERLHDVVGDIGDVIDVQHRENVVAWHMAHSFVRGNWARESESTPMIVAKCVHDFDILTWNLPSPVARLTSYGSLFEFIPERAPLGSTARCLDCSISDCPYDARPVYLNLDNSGWPVSVATDDLSPEGRREALRTGPYGMCVYHAGSTVVDHQVVAMQLENGATVSLAMHGHSDHEHRSMRYDGTKATVRGVFGRSSSIEIRSHRGGEVRSIPIPTRTGHGGGDAGIMHSFARSVLEGTPGRTNAADSLESHLLAFAAERSRITGAPIHMSDIRRPARNGGTR
jgi:predicted dehydrogenase